jgi:hypothetical protein
MPRINVEEDWYSNPRREALIKKVGNSLLADGVALSMWKLSQGYYQKGHLFIPPEIFEMIPYWKEFEECLLAKREKEGIYICGTKDNFLWMTRRKEAGRIGGVASAAKRKQVLSTAKAPLKHRLSTAQANPSNRQATVEQPLEIVKQKQASSLLFSSLTNTKSISATSEVANSPPSSEFDNSSTLANSESPPPRKGSPPSPLAVVIRQIYQQLWKQEYDGWPRWSGMYAKQALLIETYILEETNGADPKVIAQKLLKSYFSDKSWRYTTNKHPLGFLASEPHKWMPKKDDSGPPTFETWRKNGSHPVQQDDGSTGRNGLRDPEVPGSNPKGT